LTEEEKKNRPKVTPALIRRILSYLKPYWKQIFLVICCILAAALLNLYPSVLTGRIIDEGLIDRNMSMLVRLVLLSFGVGIAASLISVAESYLNSWIAQHITYDMRNTMFAHLQQMPQSFFTTNNQGDIITRMTSDIDGVRSVITSTFSSILSNSITLVIALTAMFQKNWILALVGIVIVPLFTIPTRKAGKKRWSLTNESQQVNDEVNGILNETLSVSGQLLVKLFGKEKHEFDRYKKANQKMIDLNIKESMAGRWFIVVLSTFTSVGPMLIYLAGGIIMMKYDPNLSIGDITVLVALLGRIYMPVNSLLNIQVEWIRSMALFKRIFDYFDIPVEIKNADDAVIPDKVTGDVVFEHVEFSYEESKKILKDINFTLNAGKSIAIVGPSGSGKSTIVNLIPRLYDVDSGSVTFDGIDVRKLDLGFLRGQVGVVSQETYLFNGTIRDNLLYAKPDASENDMIEALKKANIWDFVEKQEKGIDTEVGNRGLKLSGGEKQRISIARIILKDPTIFIFDEATSA
ncbi:MAG: ABC transporter ATP-binding protein, partial [Erysipelotrichaceae bacterium]|nr:ABC transporter ATP-binding protein [Erysipelotrichaceae bacterium]